MNNEASWTGIYRAKVNSCADPEKRGRVLIWIPDLMPEISSELGLWASPANNPMGGRNSVETGKKQYFQGTCYIPPPGSYVYVFFEYGNPNEPRYLAAGDFGQTKVPVECQQGSNYWEKWVIFKSRNGRTIVVSDDPHDERVEITGKKRKLSGSDPSGNSESVYEIDGNQTTILLDERSGNEMVLIKSHSGDFIKFDITNRQLHISMADDINMRCAGSMSLTVDKDLDIRVGGSIKTSSGKSIHVTTGESELHQSGDSFNINSSGDVKFQAGRGISNLAAANITQDASMILSQQGASTPAAIPSEASPSSPNGDRNDPELSELISDPEPPKIPAIPETKRYVQPPPRTNPS